MSKMDFSLKMWLASLEEKEPSVDTKRWQNHYVKTCSRSCCYATNCGIVQCTFCRKVLTPHNGKPFQRIICIGCGFVEEDDWHGPKAHVPASTFCLSCFQADEVKHQHCNKDPFCLINEEGKHSLVFRNVGFAELKRLTGKDIRAISIGTFQARSALPIPSGPLKPIQLSGSEKQSQSAASLSTSEEKKVDERLTCLVCTETFCQNLLPAAMPGCLKNHGEAVVDSDQGVSDSKRFYCVSCASDFFSGKQYCGPLSPTHFCRVCRHAAQIVSWRSEFDEYFANVAQNLNAVAIANMTAKGESMSEEDLNKMQTTCTRFAEKARADLKALHKQAWIQNIVDQSFSDLFGMGP
mmetsp:Transcript_50795/g.99569  ORF Transcript_50795/g.99569 Transcript_50795/m.99569 type:complete len:351 (+) Transcript_50795:2-1054(+)